MAKRETSAPSPSQVSFTGDERVVVLHGPEAFLQTEYTRRLRQALEKTSGGEVETIRHDGERVQLADVLDELRSLGLMQQYKLVVVTDADEFVKKYREAIERYAESPESNATLLLRAETWYKGKLDALIEKHGRIIKCDTLSHAEAAVWLTQHASQQYKIKVSRECVSLMLEYLGTELGRLDTELGKLAAGVPEGGSIGVDQIRSLVGHASDEKAWEIQEALLTGSASAALSKLHELVDLAGHDAVPINWAMSDLMRKLHYASAMLREGAQPFEVCSQLKIWPRERQQPFLDAARKIGPSRSARLMDWAIELDRRSKSGFGHGILHLERFCVRFAAAMS